MGPGVCRDHQIREKGGVFVLFSSSIFLFIFLPAVTAVYFILPGRLWRARNLVLLLASLVFYWCGESRMVLIMLGSIAVNWGLGLLAGRLREKKTGRRAAVIAAVTANVGLLFIFKYLSFVTRQLHGIFGSLGVVDIALPIGISFYTFQAMSYVFDVARGKVEAEKNPLNVGLYIAFFPQLIAGPIIKYSDFAGQIRRRSASWDKFSAGTERFAVGFCKKVLLANTLAVVADRAFGADAPGAAFAILGAVCYTLQIYYDFSGYSDMAIGLARIFGFEFAENFRYPYIAGSVTEFWRRWHISLSGWFRDYVYIPLGGNRNGHLVRNLLVVWLLTGIWHGANWTFLVWGLFYFALLAVEKLTGMDKRAPAAVGHIYTILAVTLAWVIFRADTLTEGIRYIGAMFGSNGFSDARALLYARENWLFLICGLVFCAPVKEWLRGRVKSRRLAAVIDTVRPVLLFSVFLVAVTYIIKGTYNPFIYFNF